MNKIVVVLKGVIVNEGKVLIVQRAKDDEFGGGTWECVGGNIEFGEELESALTREINEEVGLSVTIEKILYATTFHTSPSRQVVLLTYLCSSDQSNVKLSKEHSHYKWATKKQLSDLLPLEIIDDFKKHHVFALDALI